MVPYKYHSHSVNDGIYVYSFSIAPESQQPSGHVNVGKIDRTELEIILIDDVQSGIVNNNDSYRVPIYATSMNVLRIMSGMAGLSHYY